MTGNKERLQKLFILTLILDKASKHSTFENSKDEVPTYVFLPFAIASSLAFLFCFSNQGMDKMNQYLDKRRVPVH